MCWIKFGEIASNDIHGWHHLSQHKLLSDQNRKFQFDMFDDAGLALLACSMLQFISMHHASCPPSTATMMVNGFNLEIIQHIQTKLKAVIGLCLMPIPISLNLVIF